MKASRREFLRGAAIAGTTLASVRRAPAAQERSPLTVLTPDLPGLPHTVENGVKVFQLTAERVKRRIVPFKTMDVWGFNGTSPGPAIQVNQGDRVRVVFENHLPESTTIHWHGLEVPLEMDGVPYISQPPVPPGGRFVYEFTLHQEGTFFYHAHGAMQEMMGLIGMFVIHPGTPHRPSVDHDYGIILQGWAILPSATVPNTAGMEFNWLTFNGSRDRRRHRCSRGREAACASAS
jgi:FtsP/CotA-like multicopper oxidase with cupredoxin domain